MGQVIGYNYNIMFKSNHSTTMCSAIYMEIIKYHHHHRVIKLVFSIFPHISLLYRWTCWGHPMSMAVQEGCIASCVRCSLLPDRTHKSYLLRSTAISVSVSCYMWILYVVDSGISTLSMVCQILLLKLLFMLTVALCGIACSLLSHALHWITLGGKSADFTLRKKQFLDFSLPGSDHIESEPHWVSCLCVFSTRAHTSLRMSGGAIPASKYRSSTLVGYMQSCDGSKCTV